MPVVYTRGVDGMREVRAHSVPRGSRPRSEGRCWPPVAAGWSLAPSLWFGAATPPPAAESAGKGCELPLDGLRGVW